MSQAASISLTMRRTLAILILALLSRVSCATTPLPPRPFLTAERVGVQIYRCTRQGAGFEWTFESPEAVLLEPGTHKKLGSHGAGPTWVLQDGSSVKGKVVRTFPSPDQANIPNLLLEAKPDPSRHGILSRTSRIERTDTHGGKAPSSGCDAAHTDTAIRVPYRAIYRFYTSDPYYMGR